jgi:integrase-like protein
LESAKLREIRFHDLRHTFASLLIQNGAPLTYVKEQMGHSSIQVTVDVYGHLVPSANRAEVDRLDAIPIRNPDATGEEKLDPKSEVNSLTANGAGARTRTEDLLITNQLLYQLSYAGMLAGPAVADGRKPLF